MKQSERIIGLVAGIIAIFAFVTGIQSIRQLRESARPSAGHDASVRAPSQFVGRWDGYRSYGTQQIDSSTGKVVGEQERYEEKASDEIIVEAVGTNRYRVRHSYKDGAFSDEGLFSLVGSKLVRDGNSRDFYKFAIPTIWRAPDGIIKYSDGVGELRLEPQSTQVSTDFVGLWLLESENRYLKITQNDQNTFELSEGSARQSTSDGVRMEPYGIRWIPPVLLKLTDGALRGPPPNSISGELTIQLLTSGEIRYSIDFGNENSRAWKARRIMDLTDQR